VNVGALWGGKGDEDRRIIRVRTRKIYDAEEKA
jgi:hypothetical protein